MDISDMVMGKGTPYISPEGGAKLREYKFRGNDLSLVYKYFTSPLAEFLSNHFPDWLAPNIITFASFLVCVATHIHTGYYLWELEGDIPFSVCVISGVGYYLYHLLDCTDGKQARRTGSSSALGMLFDHGTDSLNCVMIVLALSGFLQLGSTWYSPFLFLSLGTGFFMSTLEEYYVGELTLPMINGVSDGWILISGAEILTGVIGAPNWKREAILGMTFGQCTSFIIFIGIFPTLHANLSAIFKTDVKIPNFLKNCTMHIIILATYFYHVATCPLSAGYLRLIMYIYGLFECKLLLHLMIGHMCHEEFNSFRVSILAYCGFAIIYQSLPSSLRLIRDEYFIIFGLVYSLTVYLHIALNIIKEMKHYLGIKFFTITPKIASKSN